MIPLDLYTTPIDGSDSNFIYSKSLLVSPFSFMNERILKTLPNPATPPPLYLKYAKMIEGNSTKKDDILGGLELTGKNGVKCID